MTIHKYGVHILDEGFVLSPEYHKALDAYRERTTAFTDTSTVKLSQAILVAQSYFNMNITVVGHG